MKWTVEGERAKETFEDRRNTKIEEKSWPASTRRLFTRLRSGHAKELKDYRHRFLKTESSAVCIHCDMDALETIKHVMCECPQLDERRRKIFNGPAVMTDLSKNPGKCLELLTMRFEKLRMNDKMVEDEGGGSPRAAVGFE